MCYCAAALQGRAVQRRDDLSLRVHLTRSVLFFAEFCAAEVVVFIIGRLSAAILSPNGHSLPLSRSLSEKSTGEGIRCDEVGAARVVQQKPHISVAGVCRRTIRALSALCVYGCSGVSD